MLDQVHYVTNDEGRPVGVLLDMDTYRQLTAVSDEDPEQLHGLSPAELQALADIKLASNEQARLDALLTRQAEGQLTPVETVELDDLLRQIDQLTILKTRARYTLTHLAATP